MSEETSSNSKLHFLVGGLVVAVIAIGYFTLGSDAGDSTSGTGGTPPVAAKGPDDQAESSFKLDVGKDGSVSGSINQESKK